MITFDVHRSRLFLPSSKALLAVERLSTAVDRCLELASAGVLFICKLQFYLASNYLYFR